MNIEEAKLQVAETGRELIKLGLVARTWGNISFRIDKDRFAISPSGFGYENMTTEDVPIMNKETNEWEGKRKPSSEKLIHISAFNTYDDVYTCVHTHQNFATAIGLGSTDILEMTEEEKKLLGNVEIAEYGAPGTDLLNENVYKALNKNSKVILMKHHGVLVCGKDRAEAIYKAEVLEKVCKRAVEKTVEIETGELEVAKDKELEIMEKLGNEFPNLTVFATGPIMELTRTDGFDTQVDDMAQMLGERIDCVEKDIEKIRSALKIRDAVLVKGLGCILKEELKDDAEALKMLVEKAALCKVFTMKNGIDIKLEKDDCLQMRKFYVENYSKRKG